MNTVEPLSAGQARSGASRPARALCIALALMGAPVARAEEAREDQAFQQQLFGRTLDKAKAHACFSRAYDPGHLGRHPQQNVRTMVLLVTGDPGETGDPSYELGLNVSFRHVGAHFETMGSCGSLHGAATAGKSTAIVHCGVECDGGSIDVSLKDATSVLIGIPERARIWKAGTDLDDDTPGPYRKRFGADDKLFRLDRTALTNCLALASEQSEKAALRHGQ